jgi:hypothetical protein
VVVRTQGEKKIRKNTGEKKMSRKNTVGKQE